MLKPDAHSPSWKPRRLWRCLYRECLLSNREGRSPVNKRVLVVAIAYLIAARGAQVEAKSYPLAKPTGVQGAQPSKSTSASSEESIPPQSFEGTWQGIWHGYGALSHETGSQSSLTVTLTVKARGAGKFSGTASTSTWQHQPVPSPRLSLGAPPPPPGPPPPPLPTPPPSGEMLNPRIDRRTLTFEVKGPDARLVDFRLSLQGPDAGTLTVTIPAHSRVYPEFQMKRVG